MVFKSENVTGKVEYASPGRGGVSRAQEMEQSAAKAEAEERAAVEESKRQARQLEDARTAMTMFEYQRDAAKTAIYPGAGTGSLEAMAYLFSLLASEAGEANGKFGKLLRDGDTTGELTTAVILELGDVMWAVSQIANELNTPLSQVAKKNIEKLASRQERGVLGGSGDNR